MPQLDVFTNPITRARRAYPYVAVLQADIADTGRERIVAPLVPKARMPGTAGRLTPLVEIGSSVHVLVVPALTAVLAHDLRDLQGSIAKHRADIVAALDFLFLGL